MMMNNIKATSPLSNEKGSVLILALIILLLLTIMGMNMTTTSSIEVQIAANNKTYKENLYNAEGTVMYAAQEIENETSTDELIPSTSTKNWLLDALPESEVSNATNWANSDSVPGITNNSYIAVHEGFARGSSMDMTTQSQLHEYSIYGRSERDQGRSIVAVGFRKRF